MIIKEFHDSKRMNDTKDEKTKIVESAAKLVKTYSRDQGHSNKIYSGSETISSSETTGSLNNSI